MQVEQLPIVDLDALVVEDTPFKFKGVTRRIRPITTMNFMRYANAVAQMKMLLSKETLDVDAERALKAYVDIFLEVIPDITIEEYREMKAVQLQALLNLVFESVGGKTQGEAKKKVQKEMEALMKAT